MLSGLLPASQCRVNLDCGYSLCWFPLMAATNQHKLSDFKQHKCIISHFFGPHVHAALVGFLMLGLERPGSSKVWADWPLIWRLWEDSASEFTKIPVSCGYRTNILISLPAGAFLASGAFSPILGFGPCVVSESPRMY